MCFYVEFIFPDFLDGKNGYIMVTANGGINQQRVAVSFLLLVQQFIFKISLVTNHLISSQVCNIVVVARLLNAALVIPKFMLSDVWTDAR